MVFPAQVLGGQAFPCSSLFVGHVLKLRKHGLTEQGSPEAFQKMVQKICLFLFVLRLSQQMADQKRFIAGGRHFCHKYLIPRIGEGLVLIGIPAVDGMPHLMGQGKHII